MHPPVTAAAGAGHEVALLELIDQRDYAAGGGAEAFGKAALFYRLLPRWLGLVGVGVAVVCELTTFALLDDWAAYLIPLGRFPALAWLLAAGLLLPVTRRREVPA